MNDQDKLAAEQKLAGDRELRDEQEIAADQTRGEDWAKQYPIVGGVPGRPYASHLTPRQQSIRDARRQESARADKQVQADVNNQDQGRRQVRLDTAEEADRAAMASEFQAEDDRFLNERGVASPAATVDSYGHPIVPSNVPANQPDPQFGQRPAFNGAERRRAPGASPTGVERRVAIQARGQGAERRMRPGQSPTGVERRRL